LHTRSLEKVTSLWSLAVRSCYACLGSVYFKESIHKSRRWTWIDVQVGRIN